MISAPPKIGNAPEEELALAAMIPPTPAFVSTPPIVERTWLPLESKMIKNC
jgi:hypothetical protein